MAPDFEKLQPTLENFLKWLSNVKEAFIKNTIILNNKTMCGFNYYLGQSDSINVLLDAQSIIFKSSESLVIPPYDSVNLDISFMAFLQFLMEITKDSSLNESMLLGNLRGPTI